MKRILKKGAVSAFLVFILTLTGLAKEAQVGKKTLLIHLKGGLSFTDSTWRFSHPLFVNGMETTRYMDGSSVKGPFFEAGIEFKKKRVGWRFSIGTMPTKVTVNPDDLSLFETRIVTFNTNYLNLNMVYYLHAGNSRFCPFINGGLGIIICSGEINNSGTIGNLGTGLSIKPSENLFFNIGIEGRYSIYKNFQESATMDRTIHVFSPVLFFGLSYQIK